LERTMLIAYEDGVFTIKDIPMEETRVPLHPIESLSDAQRILAEAKKQRPEIQWTIKGTGPYGVHGQPS
jgi:hypothetical protein